MTLPQHLVFGILKPYSSKKLAEMLFSVIILNQTLSDSAQIEKDVM